jgi:predicted transglutaminase-like cysteine proteinase
MIKIIEDLLGITKLKDSNRQLTNTVLNIGQEKDKLQKDLITKESEFVDLKEDYENSKDLSFKFIPDNWNRLFNDVITYKQYLYGCNSGIACDVRDLLNSTYISRMYAKQIIDTYKLTKESKFKEIILNCNNFVVSNITYVTNSIQYGIIDKWDNGDLTLVKQKGDCDLSARAFVRILNDVLTLLDKKEYIRNNFQCIGFVTINGNEFGHSWAEIYDPEESKWYLCELTEDLELSELYDLKKNYIKWMSLNTIEVFYQNPNYVAFL